MESYRDLIDRWPEIKDFSDETGIPYQSAYSMYRRNSIHSKHFEAIIEAARERNMRGVTLKKLHNLGVSTEKKLQARAKNSAGVVA